MKTNGGAPVGMPMDGMKEILYGLNKGISFEQVEMYEGCRGCSHANPESPGCCGMKFEKPVPSCWENHENPIWVFANEQFGRS